MAQVSYTACPPRTIQVRATMRDVMYGIGFEFPDTLWRTERCLSGRWHWSSNPCKCTDGYSVLLSTFEKLGYRTEKAVAITGTWNRDWPGIAAQVAKFRTQLQQQREHETAVKGAKGPRQLQVTLTNVRLSYRDIETYYNKLINDEIDRMITNGGGWKFRR